MGNPLRDRRTPSELAASGQVIEMSETISNFKQLVAIVEADLDALSPDKLPPDWRNTVVTGKVVFGFADAQSGLRPEGMLPSAAGRVMVTIDMVCQRCLEPMQLPLVTDLRILFATGQADAVNDDGYEIWELAEESLRPLDLIEEALIMAMPLAATHVNDAACKESAAIEEESGDTIRPFADLKSQMREES